ncbi:hypothetical protein NE619_03945 [Anaerovorax odorimutans]|uniref:Uncharacterized protein n=1 Tax=Anaerovorax odorimutans TaxID=109327 RepID=A0ABT1RL03_9FIRM|nr:hypothetical protein [Anaerovorax odorimutans]MCQ4635870.1 hypothetical protein [Anaerovorax odorimutans]
MKNNLNFILYGIALVIILIPIAMTEALHRPMGQPGETWVLSAGLVLLILGKLFSIKKKRQVTGESIFLDLVIVVCLVAMIIWMFLKL